MDTFQNQWSGSNHCTELMFFIVPKKNTVFSQVQQSDSRLSKSGISFKDFPGFLLGLLGLHPTYEILRNYPPILMMILHFLKEFHSNRKVFREIKYL